MRIGFLVNPVAGMGGRVGLKGTDGLVEEALKLGAEPTAHLRGAEALRSLSSSILREIYFVTCGKLMGEESINLSGRKISYSVVYEPRSKITTRDDTIDALRKMLEREIDLLLFVGGDGTARDIYTVVGDRTPILGIPSGVKMFSSVFIYTPYLLGKVLQSYLENKGVRYGEIMDVDEASYRRGMLKVKLFGLCKIPDIPLLQISKSTSWTDRYNLQGIARFVEEIVGPNLMILGPGTTTKSIAEYLNLPKTVLGVDVYRKGEVISLDVDERKLLQIIEGKRPEEEHYIVVSPLGGQGFIFGRGNQQISPRVLRKTKPENILIVATPGKLSITPHLHIDTGDRELDELLSGSRLIIVGYRMAIRREICIYPYVVS